MVHKQRRCAKQGSHSRRQRCRAWAAWCRRLQLCLCQMAASERLKAVGPAAAACSWTCSSSCTKGPYEALCCGLTPACGVPVLTLCLDQHRVGLVSDMLKCCVAVTKMIHALYRCNTCLVIGLASLLKCSEVFATLQQCSPCFLSHRVALRKPPASPHLMVALHASPWQPAPGQICAGPVLLCMLQMCMLCCGVDSCLASHFICVWELQLMPTQTKCSQTSVVRRPKTSCAIPMHSCCSQLLLLGWLGFGLQNSTQLQPRG
jgi:hypothetical protein